MNKLEEFFTPSKSFDINPERFTGVSIKHFPRDTDEGLIVEFLVKSGLPENKTDKIIFGNRGTVTIQDLSSSECSILIEKIHGKVNFEKKLYCNGVVPLTPAKIETTHCNNISSSSQQVDKQNIETKSPSQVSNSEANPLITLSNDEAFKSVQEIVNTVNNFDSFFA